MTNGKINDSLMCKAFRGLGAVAVLWVASLPAQAEWKLNFQEPATAIAQDQYDLHLLVLYLIIAIGVGVFGVMIYSIIMHRKSVGHVAATFHESTAVELLWTIIPFIIVVVLAFPATRVVLDLKDARNADMTIKVIGYQWKWGYDYLDDNVFFYSTITTPPEQIGPLYYGGSGTPGEQQRSPDTYLLEVDNPMVVPVGVKVRLLLTAADVIHSWWVPQLGVKQDTIPGIVREAWFQADREGTYRGQCTELCGKNHGFMPIVVKVVSVAGYADWVAAQGGGAVAAAGPVAVGDVVAASPAVGDTPAEWNKDTLMEYGERAYATHCSACHQANGEGLGDVFPALKGSAVAIGPMVDHVNVVLNGQPGTTMASFAHLTDEDLAAIITYERNAWGNDVGDLLLPAELGASR